MKARSSKGPTHSCADPVYRADKNAEKGILLAREAYEAKGQCLSHLFSQSPLPANVLVCTHTMYPNPNQPRMMWVHPTVIHSHMMETNEWCKAPLTLEVELGDGEHLTKTVVS